MLNILYVGFGSFSHASGVQTPDESNGARDRAGASLCAVINCANKAPSGRVCLIPGSLIRHTQINYIPVSERWATSTLFIRPELCSIDIVRFLRDFTHLITWITSLTCHEYLTAMQILHGPVSPWVSVKCDTWEGESGKMCLVMVQYFQYGTVP